MAKLPCSLIVTTPVRRSARETRYQCVLLHQLERLLPHSAYALNKIVFLGGAGLVAAKSYHAYTASASLQRAYQRLAAHTGSELLLCGQSAAHYGLREAGACAAPWHLTGYMEVLAQLGASARGEQARVLCLNSTTSSAALSAALGAELSTDLSTVLRADRSAAMTLPPAPPSSPTAAVVPPAAPKTATEGVEQGTLHVCFTFPALLPSAALAMARKLSAVCTEEAVAVAVARQYEWAWRWEQGLNLLLNAAELELPVAAYFVDLRLLSASTTRLAAYAQPRYQHLRPATLLPQLQSAKLVKQLRQLELYEIKSYFCGTTAAKQELSTALAPLELQAVEPTVLTALFAQADRPLIVV